MAPSAAMALLPLFVFLDAGNGAWLSFGISMVPKRRPPASPDGQRDPIRHTRHTSTCAIPLASLQRAS
jgi:hypothetical protein